MTVGKDGDDVRKGVTVILPRHPDDIYVPSYAGMHVLNGNGEVSGSYQIKDWGFINTVCFLFHSSIHKLKVKQPIALTNSCSFGIVFHSIWQWTLARAREKNLSEYDISHNYGTPIVGETADWYLNDVHNSALETENVMQAFKNALKQEEVLEGQNGGGAGMTCHMFPAGTGTSSRIVKGNVGTEEEYTVGVIVQSNYGHTYDLHIGGVPVGDLLLKDKALDESQKIPSGKTDDGSIVIILM